MRITDYFTARPPSEGKCMSYAVGRVSKVTIAFGSSGGGLSLQVAQPLTATYLVNESAACSDASPRTF